MCIRHLAEQDAGWGDQLLKGQGHTNQEAGETQLREHHPIEQPHEDDRKTANTALKQTQSEQAGEWKSQQSALS
jgi:hypothetical protein